MTGVFAEIRRPLGAALADLQRLAADAPAAPVAALEDWPSARDLRELIEALSRAACELGPIEAARRQLAIKAQAARVEADRPGSAR